MKRNFSDNWIRIKEQEGPMSYKYAREGETVEMLRVYQHKKYPLTAYIIHWKVDVTTGKGNRILEERWKCNISRVWCDTTGWLFGAHWSKRIIDNKTHWNQGDKFSITVAKEHIMQQEMEWMHEQRLM